MLGGVVPVILVDEVYKHPGDVREAALALPFARGALHYPGRVAAAPTDSPSLGKLLTWVQELGSRVYLGLAPLTFEGRQVRAFCEVGTDFAVVDVHPDDLDSRQRMPHVDPVPLFGLIYLNREDRGGTLFFEPAGSSGEVAGSSGYVTADSAGYRLLGRIEPRFNRLAIYPGSVPHSGEIDGEWIRSEGAIDYPRLTQRLMFVPA
jgi:hypothetical protein